MPNHYHLIVLLHDEAFSKRMQSFGQSYTNAINKRYSRVGPLFQGPFQAEHVDREEYLLHLSRYIHLNPVTAGLVRAADDWEYSSYRDYLGIRKGSLPNPEVLVSQFSSVEKYRRFVENGLPNDETIIRHLKIDG